MEIQLAQGVEWNCTEHTAGQWVGELAVTHGLLWSGSGDLGPSCTPYARSACEPRSMVGVRRQRSE